MGPDQPESKAISTVEGKGSVTSRKRYPLGSEVYKEEAGLEKGGGGGGVILAGFVTRDDDKVI